MTCYTEIRSTLPVLSPKQSGINELWLANRHLRTYVGCELGCPYCDAWAYSERPIDERIGCPTDLPQRLEDELQLCDSNDVIGLDFGEPYQPAEKQYRVTRQVLEVLAAHAQPCVILTKSPSVLEDLPLLLELNQKTLVLVVFTIVTVDDALGRLVEPNAPSPEQRFEATACLHTAGIPCGFALLPIIPFVTDSDDLVVASLESLAVAQPDFVVWDYLFLPNAGHRQRIVRLLAEKVEDLAGRYGRLYGENPHPRDSYKKSTDQLILSHCQRLGLEVRVPATIYSDRLPSDVTAELIRRREAFFDTDHPSFH